MKIQDCFFWILFYISWKRVSSIEYASGTDDTNRMKTSKENLKSNTYFPPEPTSAADVGLDACNFDDFACLAMAQSDRLGLEAIKSLHKQLDDDQDGNIDLSESDDFLKEELKYDSGYEKRQKNFHRNDDMHISVKELWEAWLRSEVHNWTVEQTTDWLKTSVELPQYIPNFIQSKVNGASLPRLAGNNANYLAILGIKDPIHKQKIALKAMDVVLFGPPKDTAFWKDLTLIFLTIVGGLGVWYAFQQNKNFKNHLNRMNRDMDSLQNAEKALENLQKELDETKQAQESVITEKQNLEKKLQASKSEICSLPNSYSDLEVSQLKAEIDMLRKELEYAEGELKDRCWTPPPGLQHYLQFTYELENKVYLKKKISAEKQLQQARDACEKLRKKRSSLVGAFVSTHGKSIDEVDRSIVEARTALNEVTQELQERMYRWKQIEMFCGFNIVTNNGYAFLENILYRNPNGRTIGSRGRMSSTDDLDDDTSSVYGTYPGHIDSNPISGNWKDGDSSESEVSKQDEENLSTYENKSSNRHQVNFLIGGEVSQFPDEPVSAQNQNPTKTFPSKMLSGPKSASQSNMVVAPKAPMTRSVSQDIGTGFVQEATMTSNKGASASDTCLDTGKPKATRPAPIREQPATFEEDVCSTDSSVLDEGDVKKKKRKNIFNFSKKNKKSD